MKIIVTRPRLEAAAWVKQLQDLHLDAVALPLIHIGSASDPEKMADSWRNLHQYHAVMFVSSNAVRYFYPLNVRLASEFIAYTAIKNIANLQGEAAGCRMWATGPGTREALLAQGVASDRVDAPAADAAQFDSETLWSIVKNQVKPGDKVLMVRGSSGAVALHGRSWLVDQLTSAGVQVDSVVSYQRSAPILDAAEVALMRQASTDESVWLLSSSESVANLQTLAQARPPAGSRPGSELSHAAIDWSQARAIATHPRIAQAAKDAGFGVVYESRPLLEDVVACIESLP